MKKSKFIDCLFMIGMTTFLFFAGNYSQQSFQQEKTKDATMKITSAAFDNNRFIPSKYTCDGKNINPPLAFSEIPEGTRSFVLIVDDPDAPAGTWVHWVLYNIPPDVSTIKEDNVSDGLQGKNSFGKSSYGGPCPPSGTHRYYFKLYALNTILPVFDHPDKKAIETAMKNHILAQAELIGLYKRE